MPSRALFVASLFWACPETGKCEARLPAGLQVDCNRSAPLHGILQSVENARTSLRCLLRWRVMVRQACTLLYAGLNAVIH